MPVKILGCCCQHPSKSLPHKESSKAYPTLVFFKMTLTQIEFLLIMGILKLEVKAFN